MLRLRHGTCRRRGRRDTRRLGDRRVDGGAQLTHLLEVEQARPLHGRTGKTRPAGRSDSTILKGVGGEQLQAVGEAAARHDAGAWAGFGRLVGDIERRRHGVAEKIRGARNGRRRGAFDRSGGQQEADRFFRGDVDRPQSVTQLPSARYVLEWRPEADSTAGKRRLGAEFRLVAHVTARRVDRAGDAVNVQSRIQIAPDLADGVVLGMVEESVVDQGVGELEDPVFRQSRRHRLAIDVRVGSRGLVRQKAVVVAAGRHAVRIDVVPIIRPRAAIAGVGGFVAVAVGDDAQVVEKKGRRPAAAARIRHPEADAVRSGRQRHTIRSRQGAAPIRRRRVDDRAIGGVRQQHRRTRIERDERQVVRHRGRGFVGEERPIDGKVLTRSQGEILLQHRGARKAGRGNRRDGPRRQPQGTLSRSQRHRSGAIGQYRLCHPRARADAETRTHRRHVAAAAPPRQPRLESTVDDAGRGDRRPQHPSQHQRKDSTAAHCEQVVGHAELLGTSPGRLAAVGVPRPLR